MRRFIIELSVVLVLQFVGYLLFSYVFFCGERGIILGISFPSSTVYYVFLLSIPILYILFVYIIHKKAPLKNTVQETIYWIISLILPLIILL